jgi:hypothetical protein
LRGLDITRSTTAVIPAAVVTWIADHKPAGDDLWIDLVHVVFFAQLAILFARRRRVHDHDVLQRLRHGVLEHAFQRSAIRVELEIVHEQTHLRAVSRVAHGLVIDLLALLAVGLRQRTQAAGGVERLVQRAVDFDFLEALEWRGLHDLAIDDRLARDCHTR